MVKSRQLDLAAQAANNAAVSVDKSTNRNSMIVLRFCSATPKHEDHAGSTYRVQGGH